MTEGSLRAPLQLLWALLVNSVGMIADGYDLMVVDLTIAIVSHLHPEDMTPEKKGFMACMAYAGVVLGMLLFGLVADRLGHRGAGLLTTGLAAIGCLSSAFCQHSERFDLAYQLGLCRFLLGLGVGGEYPVSMTLGSGKKTGNLFRDAGLDVSPVQVLLINISCFFLGGFSAPLLGSFFLMTRMPLRFTWRILMIIGMFPSVGAFIARTRMPSHAVEEVLEVDRVDSGSGSDGAGSAVGSAWQSTVLTGCCITWALHNFVFFGQGSFRSLIDQRLFQPSGSGHEMLEHNAHFGLALTFISLLTAVALVPIGNRISLFWSQLLGFVAFSLLAGLCSLFLGPWPMPDLLLFILLCLWTIPLTTVGIVCYVNTPQHFPAKVSGTNCGIAAAAAKAGALLGTALFPVIEQDCGMSGLMLVCCLVGAAGVVATFLLTPMRLPEPGELKSLRAID